jgi:transposase InsO family protein
MGPVGDFYANAMFESFNATLERELPVKYRFKNHREASLAIFDFIEGWYNPHRRHSALGHLSQLRAANESCRLMSKSQPSAKAGQL